MTKLLSDLIGMPIYEDSMPTRPVALIRDAIVDPENGSLIAFMTHRRKILLLRDTRFFQSVFFVHSADDLLAQDEVIRVDKILQKCPSLLGLPVYTNKNNVFIGRIVDLELDITVGQLVNMYTSKLFLFVRYDERILSAKNIVEIHSDRIIVKDTSAIKEPKKNEVEELAMA